MQIKDGLCSRFKRNYGCVLAAIAVSYALTFFTFNFFIFQLKQRTAFWGFYFFKIFKVACTEFFVDQSKVLPEKGKILKDRNKFEI